MVVLDAIIYQNKTSIQHTLDMLQRKNIATDNLYKISYKNSANENNKDLHPMNHTEKEETVRENR